MHQLVIRCTKHRIARARTEPRAINQTLRMLNAEADRERFCLDINATIKQHLERVTRAVADGENHVVGANGFAVFEHDAANLFAFVGGRSGIEFKIDHFVLKAKFAAERLDGFADVFNHFHESKRAHVRLAGIHDFIRRSGLDKLLQNLATVVLRILHLRPQFAVRKRARTAFAKLYVGLRVKLAFAPKRPRIFGPFAHDFAALQDDGFEPHLCEDQCGQHAARAQPDDYRSQRVFSKRFWLRHEFVRRIWRHTDV